MPKIQFDLAKGENARFQELAAWHRDSFLSAVFPVQGRRNEKGAEGDRLKEGKRKTQRWKKGLRWGLVVLACYKGKQARADKQQADMKGFHSMRRSAEFFFTLFLKIPLGLHYHYGAVKRLHKFYMKT